MRQLQALEETNWRIKGALEANFITYQRGRETAPFFMTSRGDTMKDILPALIGAVFASSGFWAFVQFWINRNDGTKAELKAIMGQIAKLSDRVDHNAAVLARTHILRFDDELLNGVAHSQEYFRQQMDDIDTYEEYCVAHPDFRNSYATIASEHIRETYRKLLDKRAFGKEIS